MSLKNKLIEKLSQGTASKAELHLLFDLLYDDGLDVGSVVGSDVDMSADIDLDPQVDDVSPLSKEASQSILKKINKRINQDKPDQKISKRPLLRRLNWVSKAAILLILVGVGFAINQSLSSKTVQHATQLGEVKTIELPDGSMVVLNERSKISYLGKWQEDQERVVDLEGNAYFKVQKKPTTNVKFKVKTSDLSIEVLGTIFNVSSIDEKTSVFLEEGKVVVKLKDEVDVLVELKPGEQVEYSNEIKTLSEPLRANVAEHTSWKQSLLQFKNIPLLEITERLYALSGIKVHIEDEIDVDPKYSITIPSDDIEAAIAIISKTTGYKVVKDDPQTLTLSINK